MGIGLLEVVERTLGGVLPQMPQLSLVPEEVRHSRAVQRLDEDPGECLVGAAGAGFRVCTQCFQESVFQSRSQPEKRGVPFPGGVDVVEPAVVQFVTEVERQVQVLAVRIGLVDGTVRRQGAFATRTGAQGSEDSVTEDAAARRQDGLTRAHIRVLRRFHVPYSSPGPSRPVRSFSADAGPPDRGPRTAEPLTLRRWLVSHQG